VTSTPSPETADRPVTVTLLLELAELRLPDGHQPSDTQEPYPSWEALEAAVRRGAPIAVAVTTTHRYGMPHNGGFTHIIREVHGYLTNQDSDYAWVSEQQWRAEHRHYRLAFDDAMGPAYPHPLPLPDLRLGIRLSATWMCGNAGNNVQTLPEPGTRRCPACFGLPREPRPTRLMRAPSVRALPDGTGPCLAHELLPGRHCRTEATWQWHHTPVCLRHLTGLREQWLTSHVPGRR
jgi:hypothetical protein